MTRIDLPFAERLVQKGEHLSDRLSDVIWRKYPKGRVRDAWDSAASCNMATVFGKALRFVLSPDYLGQGSLSLSEACDLRAIAAAVRKEVVAVARRQAAGEEIDTFGYITNPARETVLRWLLRQGIDAHAIQSEWIRSISPLDWSRDTHFQKYLEGLRDQQVIYATLQEDA